MAIYDVSTLGDQTNLITFNDTSKSPLFRMTARALTKRELREFDISIPESIGDADYQTLIGKEYLLLSGTMYPDTEVDYHKGREMLRKVASLPLEQSDPFANRGYILYKWNENVPKQIEVKAEYVNLPESTRYGITQPFSILCKIRYPVAYSQSSKSVSINNTVGSQLGGATIPTIVPMSISSPGNSNGAILPFTLPVILGSSSSTSNATAINAGDFPTFPVIQIYGPISKPRITNLATGEFIELQVNLAGPSNSAIITYDQNDSSVTVNGANAYSSITTGSNFFKVYPGSTTFTLSGSAVGVGASATITFFDAWPWT